MTGIEWLRQLDPKDAAGLLIHGQWYFNKYHLLDPTLPQFDMLYTTIDGKKFIVYDEAFDHQLAWLEGEIKNYDEMVAGAARIADNLREYMKRHRKK